MARKPRGDYIPSRRGSGGGFDAARIMEDLHGGLTGHPTQRPIKTEAITDDRMDRYFGRTIAGSELAVIALKEELPELYIIEHDGRFIIPFTLRHALPKLGPKTASHKLRRIIHEDYPGTAKKLPIKVSSVSERETKSDVKIELDILDKKSAGSLLRDARDVAGVMQTRTPNFNGPGVHSIRIAERSYRVETCLDSVAEILSDHGLLNTTVELGPVQVCELPSKEYT